MLVSQWLVMTDFSSLTKCRQCLNDIVFYLNVRFFVKFNMSASNLLNCCIAQVGETKPPIPITLKCISVISFVLLTGTSSTCHTSFTISQVSLHLALFCYIYFLISNLIKTRQVFKFTYSTVSVEWSLEFLEICRLYLLAADKKGCLYLSSSFILLWPLSNTCY